MITIDNIDDVTRNEEVVDIYGTYHKVIAPLTIQLESLDGDFPIAILNEIRAIFTHISRCCFTKDLEVYKDNIQRARSHTKRAILDCFKYLCLSYDEHYKQFEKMHANVDLLSVDNGNFLPQLKKMRKSAVDLVKKAKKLDFEGQEEDKLYKAYEDAYNAYNDVYEWIDNSHEKLAKAKRKSTVRDIAAIVGAIGTVLGIAFSIFFGVMSMQ